MKKVNYKDGSYKIVEHSWEYENDPGWASTEEYGDVIKPREFWVDDLTLKCCGPWEEIKDIPWPDNEKVLHVVEVPCKTEVHDTEIGHLLFEENKKLRQEIETLNTRVESMKNIENCRFGKAGECIYPNAKYKNCLTACDKWDLDTRLLHRTIKEMELIDGR